MDDPVICIIVDGVRLLRNEGTTFMRHASMEENDARVTHVAHILIFDAILATLSLGNPVTFPPPSSPLFLCHSPPIVDSSTPSDGSITLFDTFLD